MYTRISITARPSVGPYHTKSTPSCMLSSVAELGIFKKPASRPDSIQQQYLCLWRDVAPASSKDNSLLLCWQSNTFHFSPRAAMLTYYVHTCRSKCSNIVKLSFLSLAVASELFSFSDLLLFFFAPAPSHKYLFS